MLALLLALQAAPVAPPPPMPIVDCLPGPWIVFFPRGGATLDRQATSILDNALRQQDCFGDGRITLAGHRERGERAGVDRRRAAAVRGYLMRGGIPAARIAPIAMGSAAPRVAPADGAPDRQDRRAEITIGPARD